MDMFFKNLGATSKFQVPELTWSKFHTEDPQILGATIENVVVKATRCLVFVYPALHKYRYGDQVRDDVVGIICRMCGRRVKCFQNFCQGTLEEETTEKIWAWKGRTLK
jgi:hypothetical protein